MSAVAAHMAYLVHPFLGTAIIVFATVVKQRVSPLAKYLFRCSPLCRRNIFGFRLAALHNHTAWTDQHGGVVQRHGMERRRQLLVVFPCAQIRKKTCVYLNATDNNAIGCTYLDQGSVAADEG
jgi:hypothetical protein